MLALILLFLTELPPWFVPLAVSSLTGAGAGYGSFRYGQGALQQRLSTVERDVERAVAERSNFVTRDEFKLILDDLREIKTDVRELRRSLTK